MTDIGQIRTGLANAVDNLGLAPYNYSPASPPISNAAYFAVRPFDYHLVLAPGAEILFLGRFLIAGTNEQAAQQFLDELISPAGPRSAVAAIEADSTLGGVVSSVKVQSLLNYGPLAFTDGQVRQAADLSISVYI